MKIRIRISASKVRDSKLWHYDVEEFKNGKWRMAITRGSDDKLYFYCGHTEDLELAKSLARMKALDYIRDRKTKEQLVTKEFEKRTTYIEEIRVEE